MVTVKNSCSTAHPLVAGTLSNELATAADLNETSLEQSLIDIAAFVDERGLLISTQGRKLIVPSELQFVADRLTGSAFRPGTSDNDVNALRNMGMIPEGYTVNNYLTDKMHSSLKPTFLTDSNYSKEVQLELQWKVISTQET